MNIVVGSGPAGVACAKGLLARGLPVTMLDAGLVLEREKSSARERLASAAPAAWPPEAAEALRAPFRLDESGVPLKTVFGSDFPFRAPPGAPPLEQRGTRALRSYARGGLSQAWGATFLPYAAEDLDGWPLSAAELSPHYRAVMEWVPLSARRDGLDALFPLHSDSPGMLPASPQAELILDGLARRREAVEKRGFLFGAARLAVRSAAGDARGCVRCGACLHGCPYGSIYCAEQTLEELRRDPHFSYRPGVLVKEVSEDAAGVRVKGMLLDGGGVTTVQGARVFLAAGVLPTAQILAASGAGASVKIQTSQSFLVPALLDRAVPAALKAPFHALSQVYLALRDPAVSRRLVQLQVYTYNDLLPEVLRASPGGFLFRLLPPLEARLLERLVVVQGLLHSDDSDPLSLRMDKERPGGPSFTLSGVVSGSTRGAVRRVLRALWAARKDLGFSVLPFLSRVASPGQSFHVGASWPMSDRPGRRNSDRLGRPAGFSRIHAVDATVLPAVPAPPPTFTVMANAHRIATHA